MTVRRSSLRGSVKAPPSKSYTHRALFCAALADGKSEIRSPLSCEDTLATSRALSKLGVETKWEERTAWVTGPGTLGKPEDKILCGESGTTLRFMTATCATTAHEASISGEPSLLRRPIADLATALQELGAHCQSTSGYPPVYVKGPIEGGSVKVPGDVSSQYVSALILAAPLAKTPVEISVTDHLESKPYVKMTLEMQHRFAIEVKATEDLTRFESETQTYRPADVEIESDWSSAAYLLSAGTIAGERILVEGLTQETAQADRHVLNILKNMGAQVNVDSSSATVEKSSLRPIQVDLSDNPDLFPAVCVLCAAATGDSMITGIRRLRIKESNRVLAMSEGLKKMGIESRESENELAIKGGEVHSAVIDSYGDHRIAMAYACLGLCTDGLTIVDAECVEKSYPSFWRDLRFLGADVVAN